MADSLDDFKKTLVEASKPIQRLLDSLDSKLNDIYQANVERWINEIPTIDVDFNWHESNPYVLKAFADQADNELHLGDELLAVADRGTEGQTILPVKVVAIYESNDNVIVQLREHRG